MAPNPILKVLSTFRKHNVKSLLIGGQACIIYGAAEFSRDSDFVILGSSRNIEHLQKALKTLKAVLIYVPPLKSVYLERGHACHFRCAAKGVEGLRVDVISKLRGCEGFDKLWERRNTVRLRSGETIEVIGLRDLVQSKKTQRDKDWLMLKRLVENDIILNKDNPSGDRLTWWFYECRDADTLVDLAARYPKIAARCAEKRALLHSAIASDTHKLGPQIHQEEVAERQKDKEYWEPLKKELEALRHKKNNEV